MSIIAAVAAASAVVSCGSGQQTSSGGTTSGTGSTSVSTARPGTTEARATTLPTQQVQALATTTLELDPTKNYGDKYASGILPVGDSRFVADAPKKGFVYLCRTGGVPGVGGASTRGPWFVNSNTEYDINKKVNVVGEVEWDGQLSVTVAGGKRVVATNDVPNDHTTGVFPVQASDPAYQYDRNPNRIAEQELRYELSAEPQVLDKPSCMGGEAGVMGTGVALFNAFDAANRDAGAWEVQDGCDGHPQITGKYHYHSLSRCIEDVDVTTVIGWALDGFPITGPRVGEGNVLTTDDLDECHGITSTVNLDGKSVKTYHYVMTQDFPYSVSCFRGTPTQPPRG